MRLFLLCCSLVLVSSLPGLCASDNPGPTPDPQQTAPGAPARTKGPEPLRIARGERVELSDYLVPGKITVFDFTSEYCPPCRAYDPTLLALHRQRTDVAVVKVDINRPGLKKIDWQSPVAQQYGMRSIPHFKIYGPDGMLIAEDRAARVLVNRWIAELK